MNGSTRILEPGQMEVPPGKIRFLFLPGRDLFSRRAERLRFLSGGSSLAEYLAFLAKLADAQQEALNGFPALSLPGADEQELWSEQSVPVLEARSWQRDPAWRQGLFAILREMGKASLPPAAHNSVTNLLEADDAALEEAAGRTLSGDFAAVAPRELPFIAAALQVYWVKMASALKEDSFGRSKQGGLCPVCGSHPGVGIVRSGGTEQGLRYLSCSLCASQWHRVRLTCSSCESTGEIDYHILAGSNGAVKAESCGRCNSYLKLLYLEKDRNMEAAADDLATLPLDMLMDREGRSRGGPNLFFHPGKTE